MQLDRTLIAVRERNVLDILDLSLHVLRHYWRPVGITFLIGAVPLAIINLLLIGWIPDFDVPEESLARYIWLMLVLVYFEAPLAGAVTTAYLGKAVFMQEPRIWDCLRDCYRSAVALVWTQLILRGTLPAWLLLLTLERYGEFNGPVEVGFMVLLSLLVIGLRAFRPYIMEVVLLEKNPLFSRGKNVMTIGGRSSRFHSPNSGEVFARWIACSLSGLLLCASFIWTMLWFPGVFTNNWQFGPYMLYFGLPAALWLVVAYFTVVRFLNYLDLRIRQEGWEVELRVRAEAARMKLHAGEEALKPTLADRSQLPARALLLAVVVMGLMFPQMALAQGSEVDPVESARESLASRGDFPWYDRQADALRRVEVTPQNPNPNPSNPNWKAAPPAAPTGAGWWQQLFWNLLFYLFWMLIIGLIVLVIWLMVVAFLKNEGGLVTGSYSHVDEERKRADADRIEQLPFRVAPTNRGDLLSEAKRLYEEGNYRQALIYLFSFQLLLLDRHHLIRLTKGKTNRQYLRETRSYRRIAELFEGVMLPFEDVFFGDHPIDRTRFEGCWNTLTEFQQLVEQEGVAR